MQIELNMADEKILEEKEENKPQPYTLRGIEIKKDSFLVFHHEKLNIIATDEEYRKIVKKDEANSISYDFKEIKALKYKSHFGKGVLKIAFLDPKKKTVKEVFKFGGKHGSTNIGAVMLDLDMRKLGLELYRYKRDVGE
ncbi:MAG: hypothetical protein MJ238_01535 [Bacilli bacterium]|nr:hypothetical protein [Bacilli bacterium]